MIQYGTRRILAAIPVVLGVLLVVFFMARAFPGDPCYSMLGEKASPEICEQFIKALGLDKPIPVRFVIYLQELARGDLGVSLQFGRAGHRDSW